MIKYETLDDVMQHISTHHKFLSRAGGYGLVLLRKPNGQRIIVQEMRYFRIFGYKTIAPNFLMIQNIMTGLAFKGKELVAASSNLYLTDLVQVNVYDSTSHFISRAGIDFAYVDEEQSATIKALQEFVHNSTQGVRVRWTDKNANEEDLLDAMSFGHKKSFVEPYRRNIAIDCGDI